MYVRGIHALIAELVILTLKTQPSVSVIEASIDSIVSRIFVNRNKMWEHVATQVHVIFTM